MEVDGCTQAQTLGETLKLARLPTRAHDMQLCACSARVIQREAAQYVIQVLDRIEPRVREDLQPAAAIEACAASAARRELHDRVDHVRVRATVGAPDVVAGVFAICADDLDLGRVRAIELSQPRLPPGMLMDTP